MPPDSFARRPPHLSPARLTSGRGRPGRLRDGIVVRGAVRGVSGPGTGLLGRLVLRPNVRRTHASGGGRTGVAPWTRRPWLSRPYVPHECGRESPPALGVPAAALGTVTAAFAPPLGLHGTRPSRRRPCGARVQRPPAPSTIRRGLASAPSPPSPLAHKPLSVRDHRRIGARHPAGAALVNQPPPAAAPRSGCAPQPPSPDRA